MKFGVIFEKSVLGFWESPKQTLYKDTLRPKFGLVVKTDEI